MVVSMEARNTSLGLIGGGDDDDDCDEQPPDIIKTNKIMIST